VSGTPILESLVRRLRVRRSERPDAIYIPQHDFDALKQEMWSLNLLAIGYEPDLGYVVQPEDDIKNLMVRGVPVWPYQI
jgi:hypothetical protein